MIIMYIAGVELSGRITRRSVNEYIPILNYLMKKGSVGGLLVVINSEGGDANSSEILYNKILEIRDEKPVFAVIQGMGASGAYWIATASNRIYAMDTSLVGSIGVISIFPNVMKLMEKIGVTVEVSKIGEYKDMVSPFSEMSPESREKFRRIMDATFSRFRNDVRQNRKVPDGKDSEVFNGQIFSAKDALENGLIDEIGDLKAASSAMAASLSIGKKVRMFYPRKPLLNRIFSPEVIHGVVSSMFRGDL